MLIYYKPVAHCQLNCSHCYTSGSEAPRQYADTSKTLAFLHRLHRYVPDTSMKIVFHGGEPMLAPIDQLEDICRNMPQWKGGTELSVSTNLVYPLTDKKLNFFNTWMKEGMGSSWDNLRFENRSQLDLWERNSRVLNETIPMTLFVTMDKKVVNTDPRIIIEYAISLGYKYILFERITNDGHAKSNPEIKPDNAEQDFWLHKMLDVTIENRYYEKIGNMFLNEIAEAVTQGIHSGNRCRNCESSLMTINADGTIAGCPNTAPMDFWGNINQSIEDLFNSKERKKAIFCETQRDPRCYECEAFAICNGDCTKLEWQGDYCQAPKSIWKYVLNGKQEVIENEFTKLLLA